MVFNSYVFIFWFFPLFLACWNLFKRRYAPRLWLLLIASYVFYAWWDYRFTALLAVITVVNWFAGTKIHHSKLPGVRKATLVTAIILSLIPLFFFKYLPWLGSYAELFLTGTAKERYVEFLSCIILPVGVSFFTFQAMSYTVDLYNEKCDYCESPLKFATYVGMFPQLLAGPIIRFRDIAPQLGQVDRLENEGDISHGLELFFRGLIKKVFFADRLGILIDPSFASGAEVSTGLAWLSILGYSLQIYFDFSGYSDMAIGIGRCLGFRFPDNFLAPYTAGNPSEFWRRWHITLSSWLRDYLYVPMGGNRKGEFRTYQNLLVTMLLGGLWHGASWTFVFWGGWHGLMLCLHRITPEYAKKIIPKCLSVLLLNLGVIVGWVFFKMPTMGGAFEFLSAMVGVKGSDVSVLIPWPLVFLILGGYFLHYLERRDQEAPFPRNKIYAFSLSVMTAISILELGRDVPFIYFQF